MARTHTTPPTYRLHLTIAGWVPDDWTDRFEGITVCCSKDGFTVMTGRVQDQSALFGILRSIETLGMKLIACFAYPGGVS